MIKVLMGAAAFPSKDDQRFANFLKANCKASLIYIHASSVDEWLETIHHATLLVSGRFHHSIAAFCLNTPFLALNSNTPKVEAISSFLSLPKPLLFSDPELLMELELRTDEILSSPIADNKMKVAEICTLAEKNFDGVSQL